MEPFIVAIEQTEYCKIKIIAARFRRSLCSTYSVIVDKMLLSRFFTFISLACSCRAGPIVAGIIGIAAEVGGDAAAAAVAGSGIASAVGIGASAIWFGGYVVVNGALYYGTMAAAVGVLATGGGIACGLECAKKHGRK